VTALDNTETDGTWNAWSKYVIKEINRLTHTQEVLEKSNAEHTVDIAKLKRLESSQESMQRDITANTVEIAKLKVKNAMWAALAAFAGSAIITFISRMIK
jgi:hypothetical protein